MSEPRSESLRAVVIGGSGQIGGWLLRVLKERGHRAIGTYATVPFPELTRVDAADRDAAAAWLKEQAPDVVFYPAGFTWVDGCERDPARAYAANLEEPMSLARAAADSGARFIYFSTDYVFDGASGPYSEEATTNPLSVYGRAKLDAERALSSELGAGQLTIRTSWVYGPERQGKNFAYQLARTLSARQPLVCHSDQISSPSYGPDVARAAVLLAEERQSGLIHVVGPEVMDRVQFAQQIAAAFGLDLSGIEGKPTAALAQGAPRPLRGGLLTTRLNAWRTGLMQPLPRCVEDFNNKLSAPEFSGWVKPLPPAARKE
jgi:dTDP-4-dehydrorhamnose reductase